MKYIIVISANDQGLKANQLTKRNKSDFIKSPIRIGGLVLICLLLVSNVVLAADKQEVTFTYDPLGTVESLRLIGDFNGWNTTATPCKMKLFIEQMVR